MPTRPSHVVYLLDRYPELSQTFVRDEILELRRQGVRVTVVALQPGLAQGDYEQPSFDLSEAEPAGIVRAWLSWLLSHPLRALRVLRRLVAMRATYATLTARHLPFLMRELEGQGVQRVHTHFGWGGSAVATYLAAGLSVPFSLTLHARDMYVHPSHLQAKLDIADPPITVCDYNVQWLRDHGYLAPHIRVVPCGVVVPPHKTSTPERYAIAVGRLVPKKGLDIAIEALALCADAIPDAGLCIIGEGPERGRLEALVERHGLEDRVQLLGARSHAEVLQRMGNARVLLLPCRTSPDGDSDALPVVLREAMARAVPVVATPIAGIPELVDDTVGWLIPPEDPQACAEALGQALSSQDTALRRGTAARRRIQQHYTLEETVKLLRRSLRIDS